MKIAKTGGTTADSDKNLAFTSDKDCIMEVLSGTANISTDGSGYGTSEVTHSLGYRPAYYCFVRDPLNTGNWYPHQDGYMGLGTSVDTTKLYLAINFKEASQTYVVRYSIFGNQQENGDGTGNNNVSGKIRVAKPTRNAETEQDARRMQFFSGKNVFKQDTALSGTTTVTVNDFVVTKTIAHNLGYVPFVFILNDTSFGVPSGQMLPESVASPTASFYVNSTNIVIVIEDPVSGGSPSFDMTFKYVVLRDKIA